MTDEPTPGLHKALLEAQRLMPDPPRSGRNPHFHSEYVTLGDLLDAVLPELNRQDILLVQAPQVRDGEDVLVTKLIHAPTGEWEESATRLYMSKTDSQAQGSAITYARRYALMSMLALVGEDDDDGNAASRPQSARAADPQAAPRAREFDPGRDLAPGAIAVKTEADDTALQLAVRDLWPEQDWGLERQRLFKHLFDKAEADLTPAEWKEWFIRLANAVVKAQDLAGSTDFVNGDAVVEAFRRAFKGYALELSEPLTPPEGEPEATATPEADEPEKAS